MNHNGHLFGRLIDISRMPRRLFVLAGWLLMLILTAGAYAQGGIHLPPGSVPPGHPDVQVVLTEFRIDMPRTLPAGPTVFIVNNAGAIEHNLEIEGNGIKERLKNDLLPGQSGTIRLDLTPGAYKVYCPLEHFQEKGMRLQVTVSE